MIEYALAFLTMGALDFCYGEYTKHAADRRPVLAATFAAILYALTGAMYVSVVANPWLLIPACAGAWVGTYLSINR